MLRIKPSTQFKKDIKKFKHNQLVIDELNNILKILVAKKDLPEKYRDHNLSEKWKKYRECHVKPDVLLIYHVDAKNDLLSLECFGSHSELFV